MQELRAKIESLYGFKVKSIEHIRSSDDNDVYAAMTGKEKFFVRISKRFVKDITETNIELQFLNYLKTQNCLVASVVLNKKGNSASIFEKNRVMVLFEWIEGITFPLALNHYPCKKQSHNAGQSLAILHNASANCEIEMHPQRRLTSELERILLLREDILARYTNGQSFLETVSRLISFAKDYRNQKSILIHNDFRTHNVLFGTEERKDEIVAIVDFDWMCEAPAIKDLALALAKWSFADGDTCVNIEIFNAFLAGYLDGIESKNFPILNDLAEWIEFACLSDVATYVADMIMEGKESDTSFSEPPEELRSYMLSKARYFGSMDIKTVIEEVSGKF